MYNSFLDCLHQNVQQYTDYCFDCGCNINISNEKYLEMLRDQAKEYPKDGLLMKLAVLGACGLAVAQLTFEFGQEWLRKKLRLNSKETIRQIRVLEKKLAIGEMPSGGQHD